ncbi:MAG TPA: bifunctional hydroxymethylpyrimidine kinase/phosphomethylpyrimidine kinase [Pyrinomonadaceae bacterium]|nr:bifunctional hydroxymethylpyrimidine kinase/phosphomethylpyrimidine kinase [Pyrinomonadaceae bacterium]
MNQNPDSLPIALSIAGLDPSGGAGVLADVRAFAAFGCFPTAAITSLTFQNTSGVSGAVHQSAETVRAQVLPIVSDFVINGAKTGMLPTREVIVEVARLFRETKLPAPVVDPVMRATSGDDLIDDDAVGSLVSELFPLAVLVTPNIPEAERLTDITITDEQAMRAAARRIRELGARSVLVKGGHLLSRRQVANGNAKSDQLEAIDVLDVNGIVTVLRSELITGGEIHGSGCTLSAAIAACLARGLTLLESVTEAKRFITEAIRNAPAIGHGARPLFQRGKG